MEQRLVLFETQRRNICAVVAFVSCIEYNIEYNTNQKSK